MSKKKIDFVLADDSNGSRKSVRERQFVEGGGGHGQKTILEAYLTQ
jgi:hypothetical protein